MKAKKKTRRGVAEELADLVPCAAAPSSAGSREQLRKALARPEALVVARAASIVREHRVDGLAGELEDAFQRFLEDAAKSDPVCHAKLAVLEALDALEELAEAPFLAAARHVQLEPAWGKPVDTAVGVRARGVLALGRIGYADLPLLAGELLADPMVPVRQAAADALASFGSRAAAGALVLKLRAGDDEPLVSLSCLSALLAVAPEWGLGAARPMLAGPDASAREVAALALGQSSRDDALALLLDALAVSALSADRAALFAGIGLHRSERARSALVDVVAGGSERDARAAVSALSAARFEPGLEARVRDAATRNARADLAEALAAAFPAA
jgi:hypothetical protein